MAILFDMPRVTDAHRRARRDEIADAALRVLQRKGVSNTSIAQIVEESGLSAGAIYANFENKAELARYVALTQLGWRVELLAADPRTIRSPAEVLATVLTSLTEEEVPIAVVLQFWAEATVDPDLRSAVAVTVTELREAFETAIRPWAAQRAEDGHGRAASDPDGDGDGGEAIDAIVHRTAKTMIVLCQGYLANTGLLGWVTPEEYLATAAELFGA